MTAPLEQPRPGLSIIIPVLDDAEPLERLLGALCDHLPEDGSVERVVVDGGSRDGSVAAARRQGARVLCTGAGRGLQINAGCRAARGAWLWLLHADSLPTPEAVREMCAISLGRERVRALDRAAGDLPHWGRFEVSFDDDSPSMRLVASLMNARSRLTGVCTGDQGVYLHRRLLAVIGGVPEQPLMEDVELSRRLRRLCRPRCLASSLQTSARRWQQAGWLNTVLLMWRYRLRYWLGTSAEVLAQDYYQRGGGS